MGSLVLASDQVFLESRFRYGFQVTEFRDKKSGLVPSLIIMHQLVDYKKWRFKPTNSCSGWLLVAKICPAIFHQVFSEYLYCCKGSFQGNVKVSLFVKNLTNIQREINENKTFQNTENNSCDFISVTNFSQSFRCRLSKGFCCLMVDISVTGVTVSPSTQAVTVMSCTCRVLRPHVSTEAPVSSPVPSHTSACVWKVRPIP